MDQRESVIAVMMEELRLDRATAEEILRDDRVNENELFQFRQKIGVLPTADRLKTDRSVSATYAASILNDHYFEKAGLDADLYEDLYDETFPEAASSESRAGVSDDAIDTAREVGKLRGRLRAVVKEKRSEAREGLAEAFEDLFETLIGDQHVSVTEEAGDVIHSTVTLTGKDAVPVALDPIKKFFTNPKTVAETLPKVAKDLFVSNALVQLKSVDPNTAKDPRHLVPSKGFVIKSALYAWGPTPDPECYIHIDFDESVVGGKREVRIRMTSLTEEQEAFYELPSVKTMTTPRVKSLEGTLTLTEEEPGRTAIVFDVKTNPGLAGISDFLIMNKTIGVPGALRNSARAIGVHVLTETALR